MGNIDSGRKSGFNHSAETKRKISETMRGIKKTTAHRKNMSLAKTRYGLDEMCIKRYESLMSEYPQEREFFEDNEIDILFAMQDIRTDKELKDIRRFIETERLHANYSFQYSSSSCFAVERDMIDLLDFKLALERRAFSNFLQ